MVIAGIIGPKNKKVIPKSITALLASQSIKYSMVEIQTFIGNGEKVFIPYLKELSKNGFDLVLIYIHEDYKNQINKLCIEFDILLFCTDDEADSEIVESDKDFFANIIDDLRHEGSIIINSDTLKIPELLEGRAFHLVTYGFNSKASITASSVGDALADDFLLCSLQRPTVNISKNVVHPQEFKVKRPFEEVSDYDMLAAISFGIVLGSEF